MADPAYVCLYLALAERLEVPLMTADKRFVRSVGKSAMRTRPLTLGDPA